MDIYAFSNSQVCKSTMQQFKTGPALEHTGIMIASLHIYIYIYDDPKFM
jgi:hypothetical protein